MKLKRVTSKLPFSQRAQKLLHPFMCMARFKRRASAVSNSVDRIKFDSSTTFETKSL